MQTRSMASLSPEALRACYDELMAPAFAPAELMTYEELREALTGPDTHGLVVLVGDRPVASLVTEDYLDGQVLLVAYVVVAQHVRGRGIGAELIGQVTGDDSRLVVAEIEDPRFHPADALRGDPVARARFYRRLGSRLLPLPYLQPSLRPGSPRVEQLLLISLATAGDPAEHVDAALVADFLDEYFRICEGDDVETDEQFQALRSAALSRGPMLPLLDLSQLDAARPGPDVNVGGGKA